MKASLLKWKLRRDLKGVTDSASLMSSCRLFQSPGALTANAQSPLELSLNFRTARKALPEGPDTDKLLSDQKSDNQLKLNGESMERC